MRQNTTLSTLLKALMLLVLFTAAKVGLAQGCDPKWNRVKSSNCENSPIQFESNAPGRTTYEWDYGDGFTAGPGSTTALMNPVHSYSAAGLYIVTFKGTGAAGTCTDTVMVLIKESPKVKTRALFNSSQCFLGNKFCFIDSSKAATRPIQSKILSVRYLFSDGALYTINDPKGGDTICHSVIDPNGGYFDLTIEVEDYNGCITKVFYSKFIRVFPKLGVSFTSDKPDSCVKATVTLKNTTDTFTKLSDIAYFEWDFGDKGGPNNIIIGDSVTNTEWLLGKTGNKIIKHRYDFTGRPSGRYALNGKLTIRTKYGCTETFVYKAAVTISVLNVEIIAEDDSSCSSTPTVKFTPVDITTGLPVQGVSAFLWNFGDPPSGPANFDDKILVGTTHDYGLGPWMVTLKLKAGPCILTVIKEPIVKIGPTSTIEVSPMVDPITPRVKEDEKYQCIIRDSVHFVNHSNFYHTDPYPVFEDSSAVWRYYKLQSSRKVGYWLPPFKQDTIVSKGTYQGPVTTIIVFYLDKDTLESFKQDALSADSIIYYVNGKKVKKAVSNPIISGKDTLEIIKRKQYAFKWPGDQTAINSKFPPKTQRHKDHVLRLWDFGDNYAPKCTTDTRKKKNVGLNCNWSMDSLPVHWYTPWDQIYKFYNNAQFYSTPATKTVLCKNGRFCYKVNYYPKMTDTIPSDTLVIVPKDSTFVYGGRTITPATKEMMTGSFRIKKVPSVIKGPATYIPTLSDEKWTFYTTTTVDLKNIKTGNYSTRSTGTYTMKNMADQFTLKKGDSAMLKSQVFITAGKTVNAAATTIFVDTIIGGRDTFVQRSRIFIDSAFHRKSFYANSSRCNLVKLYHEDTVHSLRCKSTDQIQLALIPPNAKGLWFEGVTCYGAPSPPYGLQFHVDKTKPGCTQRLMKFNFDSTGGKSKWVSHSGFAAPPLPGTPWPIAHPGYLPAGAWPNTFVKNYQAGDIQERNPGWVTVGLIIGNGRIVNGVPECMDTVWYHNAFRYLYLNALYNVIVPEKATKRVCVGDTITFNLTDPIMDSITQLTWSWNDDLLTSYDERTFYNKAYPGPSPTRNDKGIAWKKTDKWLYNFVVRTEFDGYNYKTIDTIVLAITRKWIIGTNIARARTQLTNQFKTIGIDINDIPSTEMALYFGNGTGFGCIDTSGMGDLIDFGVAPYRDNLTFRRDAPYRAKGISPKTNKDTIYYTENWYRYTDATKKDSTIISQTLHWRAITMAGFDTLKQRVTTASKVCPFGDSTIKSKYYRDSLVLKSKKPPYLDSFVKSRIVSWRDSLKVNKITGLQVNPGVYRHAYRTPDRYYPTFYLKNTVGCFQGRNKEVDVGFYWRWNYSDTIICHGPTNVVITNFIRYFAYEDPFNYLNGTPYWNTPTRFINQRETMKIDFNEHNDTTIKSKKPPYCDSLKLNMFGTTGIGVPPFAWHYDDPGIYKIRIAMKDSLGCVDTAKQKVYVTGVNAGFKILNAGTLSCKNIISFFDSSVMIDPCVLAKGKPCDNIIEYTWDFGDGKQKSKLKNPSHDYTQNGYFTVRLKVRTKLGCIDSASMIVFIAGPRPYFNPISDTIICVGDSVRFANQSLDPLYNPKWEWNFGDGKVGSSLFRDTVGHRYTTPGTYEVYLTQFDNINGTSQRCSAIYPDTSAEVVIKIKRLIRVKPVAPADFDIAPNDTICPNTQVTFTSQSDTIYTRFTWKFGTADTLNTNDKFAKYVYPKVGNYKVIMVPNYDTPEFHKCLDTVKKNIVVLDVKADFTIDSTLKPKYCFINNSIGAVKYEWIFEDFPTDGGSSDTSPCYQWADTGCHNVTLIATNAIGCTDTMIQPVCSSFVAVFIPYNVFTPEPVDGFNDEFRVKAIGLEKFDIIIYNRWGEVVFESKDPNFRWNGKVKNTGAECPEGTYFYLINYQIIEKQLNDGKDKGKPISGTVTLIRGKK